MTRIRYIFLILISFLLTGCDRLSILNPKGTIAASEAHMLVFAMLLMLIVVIPVIILSFVIPWRYRARNLSATYAPDWSHSTLLEIIWWSIPCVIIAILATATWITTHQLDPYRPLQSDKPPLRVQAIALNWKWLFIYPDQNVASLNYLKIPVDRPISFVITADAPMNSFEIPQLAGQIYAMTGMQTRLHLIANTPGTYTGLSTNFSGDGFSDMRFTVSASSEAKFNQWVKLLKSQSHPLTMVAYERLTQPTIKPAVEYFSAADKNLFDMAMMKYMGPMPGMEMKMGGMEKMPDMKKMDGMGKMSGMEKMPAMGKMSDMKLAQEGQ